MDHFPEAITGVIPLSFPDSRKRFRPVQNHSEISCSTTSNLGANAPLKTGSIVSDEGKLTKIDISWQLNSSASNAISTLRYLGFLNSPFGPLLLSSRLSVHVKQRFRYC